MAKIHSAPPAATPRYFIVDQIRGLAVVLMIIFHTLYDLRWFGYLPSDLPMRTFAQIIVFLFLLSMGFSLPLAHPNGMRWPRFWKRWAKLALHCISVCSLMALPFIHRPRLAGFLGGTILISAVLGFHYPWVRMSHSSMDYIPALPWVGVVLLGIFLQGLGLHQRRLPDARPMEWMVFLGRWSLWIYLLHQPVLLGLIYLVNLALSS